MPGLLDSYVNLRPNSAIAIHHRISSMELETREQAKEAASTKSSRARFDSKKELRLTGLTHQFLSRSEPHWDRLVEKLTFLQDSFEGQLALRLCRKCLCFYNCKHGGKHDDTTIDSLFKLIDFKHNTVSDLLDLLRQHGKTIRDSEDEELIGFPGFNLECGDDYYFAPGAKTRTVQLSESTLKSISIPSRVKTEKTALSKRYPPKTYTSLPTHRTRPKKTENPKEKTPEKPIPVNPVWLPVSNGGIQNPPERFGKSTTKKSIQKP